jgi:hypothetical protein
MRAHFKCNSAPRHLPKGFLHRFRAGGHSLLKDYSRRSVQNPVEIQVYFTLKNMFLDI